MTWMYANQTDNKPSKWQWCWYLIRKTNDPDCNVVKLRVLLIEGVVNARENSLQLRKTNDLDWNVVKSRMSLFQGVIKVRENSVPVGLDISVPGLGTILLLLYCTILKHQYNILQYSLPPIQYIAIFSTINTIYCNILHHQYNILVKIYYIVLYCIVLYCIVLYCIVLYCIVLYCIVLYCIVL